MIILIVVMTVVPLGIILYSAFRQQNYTVNEERLVAERLADEISNHQEVLLSGAEQLLITLSHLPAIRKHDAEETNHLLAELIKQNPQISNILVIDPNGQNWASALPTRGAINVSDRRYFRNAMATGQLSSGEFIIGRILNKPALNFGYPIKDASGRITNIAMVALSLEKYHQLLNMKKMPPRTSLVLTDHRGIILFDAGARQNIGRQDKDDIFRRMAEGPDAGTFEAVGITGIRRYFAYQKVRLSNEEKPYMYVRTGIPVETVARRIRSELLLHVGVMTTVMIMAIVLAAYISKRGLIDKVTALRNATQKLSQGDLTVRVSEHVSGGELGELGCAFDDMARKLAEDSAERQRTEQALRDSERRFADLVKFLPDAMFALDRNGIVIAWNREMEAISGLPAADIVGRDSTEVGKALHGEPRGVLANFILSRDEDLLRRHYPVVKFDGDHVVTEDHPMKTGTRWVWAIARPMFDASGNVVGAIEVVRDVTDRKKIEEELRRSEIRYRRLFQGSHAVMLLLDPKSICIVDANPAAAAYYGYPIDELRGMSMSTINTLSPEKIAEEMALARSEGRKHFCFAHRLANGEVHPVEVFSGPIEIDGKQLLFSIVHDITKRREAEEKLRVMNEELERRVLERTAQLEAANRELESFSYSVSHDLQAPLRHMTGYSRILLDELHEKLDDDAVGYLERIAQAGVKMGSLIDALLQLSRVSRTEMNVCDVNLTTLAHEVVNDLQQEAPERAIRVSIADGLEAKGDPALLRSVLENLLGNAWKYTRHTDEAEIELGTEEKDGATVFFVRDNGVGFDMIYANKLFGAFQRLHSEAEFKGTGIGLATVKRIISRHGGDIWMHAEKGRGATVYFTVGG
ncbi:PAS domain S-box protein [Geobacter grbiciae]|uniref:PAS domain S-box protein n=1 Tax=Geobacter grbiciae TaxID=155042 RepID=UPI001C00E29A|nr:PAS domain S-box protein [Geobacter grbiciae]MBT1075911.1 PAS domain S-box protein [Geobacter grbiciae]